MTTSLSVLRHRTEQNRFQRLEHDDNRTSIPTVDSEALAKELKGRIHGEVRFDSGFALVFGPRVAVALTHGGTPGCGADTCNAYMKPGDVVITLRSGLGFTF